MNDELNRDLNSHANRSDSLFKGDHYQRSRGWIGGAAILMLLYVGGYFVLGHNTISPSGKTQRYYGSSRVALMYCPLGWFEAQTTRREVHIGWHAPSQPVHSGAYCFRP